VSARVLTSAELVAMLWPSGRAQVDEILLVTWLSPPRYPPAPGWLARDRAPRPRYATTGTVVLRDGPRSTQARAVWL
jgi:hypothetical protein